METGYEALLSCKLNTLCFGCSAGDMVALRWRRETEKSKCACLSARWVRRRCFIFFPFEVSMSIPKGGYNLIDIIEHKHFDMFGSEVYQCPKTVISKEYSTEWKLGMKPYYPVNDEHNNNLYRKYKALADEYAARLCAADASLQQDKINDSQPPVIFGGHLAEYKYYDMAPVVDKVLRMFDLKHI